MKVFFCIVVLACYSQDVAGQVKQRRTELNRLVPPASQLTKPEQEKASKLFDRVQLGFTSSSVSAVSALFNRTVHLALPGVEQGQFSKEQAAQLLAAYLRSTKTLAFDVKKKEDSVASPYLSAILRLMKDEREQKLSLYVSLVRSEDSWKIGHFSVY